MKIPASLLFFFSLSTVMAQTISGRVTDKETGESLSDVSIPVVGSSTTSVTDTHGIYSIPFVNKNAKLIFFLDNYVTLEAQAGNKVPLDIAMGKEKPVSYTTETVQKTPEKKAAAKPPPLYVVDGVAVKNNVNPLDTINLDNVANITWLQKKPATEAYGSLGANGVILVKTKKGKQ